MLIKWDGRRGVAQQHLANALLACQQRFAMHLRGQASDASLDMSEANDGDRALSQGGDDCSMSNWSA